MIGVYLRNIKINFFQLWNNGELARPEVYEFVKFYLEEGPMLAGEGGYVGLPQSMYDDGLAAISKYK